MNPKSIFFLGGGHGGICALRSLQTAFESIEIISSDEGALSLARGSDRKLASLAKTTAKCGVMAGHTGILPSETLASKTILNVHYSLLPKYRGLHSIVWAMLNLEKEVGITVHLANQNIDDGPIVYQHRVSYGSQTSWELMALLNDHIENHLGAVVRRFVAGQITPAAQDKSLATWVPKRNLNDCLIDFSWSVCRLRALFKALVRPYPLPAVMIRGKRLDVSKASMIERPYFCQNGRVVNLDDEGAWIKCEDGLVVISELLDDEGEPLSPAAMLRFGMRL